MSALNWSRVYQKISSHYRATMIRLVLILVLFIFLELRAEASQSSQWWSFRPLTNPPVPVSSTNLNPSHPIDAFLIAALRANGLAPSPPATPREQVRRAYFDLIGLPPTFAEVAHYAGNDSDETWYQLVEDLLGRPQYGERWGRHWLDIVRYAESNGYERDASKPHAWRYRDYVIDAFNKDKPYNQFVIEQLAGDQLPGFDPEAIIATGFYRLHVWDDEPDSTLQAEFDDLDDIMVTTSGAFLGLTMGCARCHEHKFDPIPQKEYYELLAFFRNINPYGLHHQGGGGRGTGRITRPLASPDELAAWRQEHQRRLTEASLSVEESDSDSEREKARKRLKAVQTESPPFAEALAVTEDYNHPKPTHLLVRGQPDAPEEAVRPGIPEALGSWPVIVNTKNLRLELAQWITDPKHPLTARVIANRIWQHHFGRGIVRTPNDFGHTGSLPTHPELLDHLAGYLIDHGWSLKSLHRHIMTSRAYRMSSRNHNRSATSVDEPNDLFWRQNPRRLEGEAIRDSLLAYAGTLNLKMGGPSVFPRLSEEVHRTQDSARKGWGESPLSERNRRSVYLVVKRALPHPFLETFDYSNTAFPLPQRPVTTVAPQALMLLNDDFIQEQARLLADRLESLHGPSLTPQIRAAFRRVLQRDPTQEEMEEARRFVRDQSSPDSSVSYNATTDPQRAAMTMFCVALFNLNEAIYVD